MIWKTIIVSLVTITCVAIWYVRYVNSRQKFISISELADVKALQSVQPAWDAYTRFICIGDCRDYDDDSRWGGLFAWWK